MRLLYYTAFFTILSACSFSCKSDVQKPQVQQKAEHLFAKYYVRYLQTEKELKAEVSFKEGDTLQTARSIVLTNVTFENNEMDVQNLGKSHGVRYGFRKKGPYSKQYEFRYSDQQRGESTHIMKMSPITDFLIKDGVISKQSGSTLVWEGEPLNANQEMILLFTDEEKKAFPIRVTGPTERTEYFLAPDKITKLAKGKGQLMLVKKQLLTTEENNTSKISEMEFYSKNLDIEVNN